MKKYKEQNINQQKKIVHFIRENERRRSLLSIEDDWLAISQNLKRKKRQKYIKYFAFASSAAAVFLFLIISYYYSNEKERNMNYEAIIENLNTRPDVENVSLYVDGKEIITSSKKPRIIYDPDGDIAIDDKKVAVQKGKKNNGEDSSLKYNSVIVPKGKQSYLTLSDGTKIWVNSRSKVIYPVVFASDKREIYLEGEAFLEVAHNKKLPFIVKTSSFSVLVLGTKFNISSYKEKQSSSVTLLEGSVNITDNQKSSLQLRPSEKVHFIDGVIEKKETINNYSDIDWVYGYYSFANTPLAKVIEKLSFYFDVDYILDESIKDLSLSGKLDIRLSLKEILYNLSRTTNLDFYCRDGKLICEKKETQE